MLAFALMVAPFVMLLENAIAIYAITDRRALIARTTGFGAAAACELRVRRAWTKSWKCWTAGGKAPAISISPPAFRPKMRDADYTGKLAFRDRRPKRIEVARRSIKPAGNAKPVTKSGGEPYGVCARSRQVDASGRATTSVS